MIYGLTSGILWGLDTVLLGTVLAMNKFISTEEAIFLAPFVSTFLHDLSSAVWMGLYIAIKGKLNKTIIALKTKSGRFIILGAFLGGPVGMTGYLLAIKYIGPAYTAIISALYPAIGAFLSYVFLNEKMKPISIIGLFLSILGVAILGYAPEGKIVNLALGLACALLCVVGWASEAVICAYGMKDDEVSPEESLQIRQLTSAIVYGFLIIPIIRGIKFTLEVIPTITMATIVVTSLAGTVSYIFYYKGICKIGATKAMALNITYSAWAIVLGIILLGNRVNAKSIICCLLIICGSVMSAGDMSELKSLFTNKKTINYNGSK